LVSRKQSSHHQGLTSYIKSRGRWDIERKVVFKLPFLRVSTGTMLNNSVASALDVGTVKTQSAAVHNCPTCLKNTGINT